MNFFFGGKPSETSAIKGIIDLIDNPETVQTMDIDQQIVYTENQYYKGISSVLDFTDQFKESYGNFRPKYVEITIENCTPQLTKSIDVYYLHTPILGTPNYEEMKSFKGHTVFNESCTIINKQPYMTSYQLFPQSDLVQYAGKSQFTNFNTVYQSRTGGVCIGQLFIVPILKEDIHDKIIFNLNIKIKYTFREY